jgi:transposase InsO family protein
MFEKEKEVDGPPFVVAAQIDQICHANTLIDTGCTTYGIISETFTEKHQLERIKIRPRPIRGYNGPAGQIKEVARFSLNIGGNHQPYVYMYVVPEIDSHDMILGTPWMNDQHAIVVPDRSKLVFRNGIEVPSGLHLARMEDIKKVIPISAAAFGLWQYRQRKGKNIEIFAASLRDIDKALRPKTYSDPQEKLPTQYHDFLEVFDHKKADVLPPLRGPSKDHRIELIEHDEKGNKVNAPWGPLYNMSREELLVLRKTLTDYLDKGFIRVSNSPAAAPVLFVKKPGGGLRFCCDYRALNRITKKDRYPLPLIHETLERIGKARWFTKLDVISAFHKIRIAEGDEWLTAFRTRFGLFEWLVTPFGLANAPSTFQRYVNWTLRDFLDEFVSAYLDDILIFSSGSLSEHQGHVRKVLQRLKDAGLQLDIDKCEFEVKSTKYLGFIIEAGKGIRMDPEKVKAIIEWATPQSVKGVRSFLGFANFYRQFIRGFSEIVAPLTDLTKKTDTTFQWTREADCAFKLLKELFTTAPILTQFDPDRETVLEADSSGWATGGVLSQYDEENLLRPCAYFSRKNSPAECNYEIHDKELLAIIRCLQEWESELSSVPRFKIITDHKNLRYFTTLRRLTERQMRWADILSRFDFTLQYRPGKLGVRPDALSRREQDVPKDASDERLRYREMQLLKPEVFTSGTVYAARITAALTRSQAQTINAPTSAARSDRSQEQEISLTQQWTRAEEQDTTLQEMKHAVREKYPRFPRKINVRVSISECELDDDGHLRFRDRRWVPESEPLRTRLMQETHDSIMIGHPGRDMTYAVLARQFFWPQMSTDVRRFCRNCHKCRANITWRDRRQGLLKPLPIPERKWREISMDFIDKLPPSMGCTSMLVLTDRLGKGVIFEPFDKMDAETLARKFIKIFYAHHGLPAAIVSDRGTQFVSEFWERICKLLKIKRRLSTAYHPETDGSTEKMNATLETYLRMFVDWAQDDWAFLAPAAMLAINNRDAASTGVSPFFLDHGYNMEPLDLLEEPRGNENGKTSRQRADAIVTKLKGALELAQAAMATAQQIQEDATNRHREPAVEHQVGDKVWLDMRHIRTDRPSKKLDNRNAKYTVIEKIGSHAYRLDTPAGIHNVFSTHLLHPAADDPFPSQKLTDYQPPAVLIDGHKEWIVEKIVGERRKRIGRGYRHEFHIKWEGYSRLTWEPAYNFTESAALDEWEAQQGTPRTAGALTVYHNPTRKGRRGGGGGYCHGRSPELS